MCEALHFWCLRGFWLRLCELMPIHVKQQNQPPKKSQENTCAEQLRCLLLKQAIQVCKRPKIPYQTCVVEVKWVIKVKVQKKPACNQFKQLIKGIVNLFSCDSQKLYLILTFTKTSFLICLNLLQQYISLKVFHIVCSSCTWFSIQKYLFEQNSLCWII